MTSDERSGSLPPMDASDIARRLEALSYDIIDTLPYGVIRLDASGRVVYFSKTEERHSGYQGPTAVGLHLFTELAPCMNTPHFRGRVEESAARGTLDVELGHTGDFADRSRFFRVRVVSASDGGTWQLHEREELSHY